MTLEHLWAGWRGDYVSGVASAESKECPFCAVLAAGLSDEDALVVWRGRHTVALLNLYPYASGHVLTLPTRHVGELDGLSPDESAELWAASVAAVAALKRAYGPDGVNMGANLGRSAGAGVPGHLHLHAVPRWSGDTNFMTTVAGIRVMPEALPATYAKVKAAWDSLEGP